MTREEAIDEAVRRVLPKVAWRMGVRGGFYTPTAPLMIARNYLEYIRAEYRKVLKES